MLHRTTALKASLISNMEMSSNFTPAKQKGSCTPISHSPRIRAMGFTPRLFAACLVIRTQAAAPSFKVLALAAVMYRAKHRTAAKLKPLPPSFKNTVGTEPNFSKFAFLYSSSSLTTVSGLPRFPGMVTGTISLAKTPS
ncbi:unnamed protein product, partial [Ixodes hexagonus]